MDQSTPQQLSMAELEELVGALRQVNERLRSESAQSGKLSSEIQEYLESASNETPEIALLALSQFLTFEHTYADLAEVLAQRYAHVFDADTAILFLADAEQRLQRVAPPLGDDPATASLLASAEAAASQAWSEQTTVSSERAPTSGPAYIALPLTRHGRRLGALTLISRSAEPAPPERWAQLSLFSGLVAVACDNIARATAMRQHLAALEELVAQRTRQVQSSRDILRLMFDHMPDGVLLLNDTEQVEAVNQFFSKNLLGLHAREVVGWPYARVRRELEQRAGAVFAPENEDGSDYPCWVRCSDSAGTMRLFEIVRSSIQRGSPGSHTLELWREHLAQAPSGES